MKPTIVKVLTSVMIFLAMPLSTFAASEAPAWLEETMFASGKINTVVMVVSAVFIGIVIWMFALDRRIAKMERNAKNK